MELIYILCGIIGISLISIGLYLKHKMSQENKADFRFIGLFSLVFLLYIIISSMNTLNEWIIALQLLVIIVVSIGIGLLIISIATKK